MSELVSTGCDSCPAIINVTPEEAIDRHGWVEDEYGSHFCVSCQMTSIQLEMESATTEEMGTFAEEVVEASKAKLKTNQKVQTATIRKAKST